jgi:outer membrane protein, heavy metal efflux system
MRMRPARPSPHLCGQRTCTARGVVHGKLSSTCAAHETPAVFPVPLPHTAPRRFHPLRLACTRLAGTLLISATSLSASLGAQASVTFTDLLALARERSPDLRAAQEAVLAAAALERQAGAFANPTLAYGREQTSRGGQSNAQNILQLEQPLELGSLRGARRDAAHARLEAAEARLLQVRIRLDADLARAYAAAIGAAQRARLADQVATVVTEAQRVSDERLAAGDVSGYAARRLRLEAARFAAARAMATLEVRNARIALVSLIGDAWSTADSLRLPNDFAEVTSTLKRVTPDVDIALDSLVRQAGRARTDLHIARLDVTANQADARVASMSRVPVPVLSAGHKDERSAGSPGGFTGFVAGITLPLAVFDRRQGAVAAADATSRASIAVVDAVMRRVTLDVTSAFDALRSAEVQRSALAPYMGDDTRRALDAVQASYAEGELTLVEWLDALRAYLDAQSTYAALETEVAIRRATLAQALGLPLLPDTRAPGSDAAAAPTRKN